MIIKMIDLFFENLYAIVSFSLILSAIVGILPQHRLELINLALFFFLYWKIDKIEQQIK